MFAGIATWLAGKFGGVAGKLLELIIAFLLLLVLVGGPYWLGMRHQSATDQIAQQKAQLALQQKLAAQDAAGRKIADKLDIAQVRTQVIYRTITREVPHVIVKYRSAPGAPLQALPRAVFTRGFVGVWNCALDPGLPDCAGESPQATGAGDPALDSGITEHDIIANHIANAHACDDIRKQLNALIEWHRLNDSGEE